MDDEAALDRARKGDRDAFAVLVTRYQDQLYTMALRQLGSAADAADVVQETFLRAYLNLPQLRGVTVRSWLYRVAVNAARDIGRRRQRRPAAPLEDPEGNVIDLPDTSAGPEETAEAHERAASVRVALDAVAGDFRIAVVLRDVNQLSYDEIAQALNVPVGTAKSRVARGRLQLAAQLRQTPLFASEVHG